MNLAAFFAGFAFATFSASAIFFLKFWKASRDSFFLCFSVACALMATERISAILCTPPAVNSGQPDSTIWVYIIRLVAFILIFYAAMKKNRVRSTKF